MQTYQPKRNQQHLLPSMNFFPLILRSEDLEDLSETKDIKFIKLEEMLKWNCITKYPAVSKVTETEMIRLSMMSTRSETMRRRASATSQPKQCIVTHIISMKMSCLQHGKEEVSIK